MLEKPVYLAIVLSHICSHVPGVHGVDSGSASLEIFCESEHRQQLRGFRGAIPAQAGIPPPFPSQVAGLETGDGEAMPLRIDVNHPRPVLGSQFFHQLVRDYEGSEIIHLEHFFNVVRGELLLRVVDAGIVDQDRDIPWQPRQHVRACVDFGDSGKIGDMTVNGHAEVAQDLVLQALRLRRASVYAEDIRSAGRVHPGGLVSDAGSCSGNDDQAPREILGGFLGERAVVLEHGPDIGPCILLQIFIHAHSSSYPNFFFMNLRYAVPNFGILSKMSPQIS
jgi:hypothetical protein